MTKTSLVLAFLFAVFVGPAPSDSAEFFVATNGSDSNPGTFNQPFRSVKVGISRLAAGDKLLIRAGTYGESIDSNRTPVPSGTSWTNPVTIAAYPGETVTIRGNFNLAARPHQYIIIDGIIVDGRYAEHAVSINQGSNHIRFQNCEIRNAKVNGVAISWGNNNGLSSDYNEILNCSIHDNGTVGVNNGHGLYIMTSNNVVANSIIFNNSGYGVHIYNSNRRTQPANNNVIQNNHIYNNGLNGHAAGIILSSGTGNMAYNNIIRKNPLGGINVDYAAIGSKIFNNTIYDNPDPGIVLQANDRWEWGAKTKDTQIINNIIYKNGNPIYSYGNGAIVSTNNLTTDPRFANPSGLDFRVKTGSLAINAGRMLAEVPVDIEGTPRRQSYPTIGAYENPVQ